MGSPSCCSTNVSTMQTPMNTKEVIGMARLKVGGESGAVDSKAARRYVIAAARSRDRARPRRTRERTRAALPGPYRFFFLRRFCGSDTEPSPVDSGCFCAISSSACWLRRATSPSPRTMRSLWPVCSTRRAFVLSFSDMPSTSTRMRFLSSGSSTGAAVEAPRHPVGGRQVDGRVARVLEREGAAVFEEAVDDGLGRDVLAEAGHAGAQAATAAHGELHDHAGARRFVERDDDLGVG